MEVKKRKKLILFAAAFIILFLVFMAMKVLPRNVGDVKGTLTVYLSPTPTATPTPTSTPTPTPSPSPTPTPTPLPKTQFETYFNQYSQEYHVDKNLLKKIAICESGMNPGTSSGQYGGMYQFTIQTWEATRKQMGTDINPDLRFNAKEAIETAAFKLANHGERAWPNCL